MTDRPNLLIRCLVSRPGLMAMAVVTGLAWQHGVNATPVTGDGEATLLPLTGLALPTTQHAHTDGAADPSATVLAPSCEPHDGAACTRLAEICQQLSGDMQANGDGSQTCLIVLE